MNMNIRFILIIAAISFGGFISCTRKASESSLVQIKVPSKAQFSNKLKTLSETFPADKKLCFAVNVTGPEIQSKSIQCGPELGISKGFVSSDESPEISLDVPRGLNRTIQLYFYAQDLNSSCPTIDVSKIDSSKVYKVGQVDNVSLQKEEELITIDVIYPGSDQSIVATLNLPATCNGTVVETPTVNSGNNVRLSPVVQQTAAGIVVKSFISSTTMVNQVSADNSIQIKAEVKFNP